MPVWLDRGSLGCRLFTTDQTRTEEESERFPSHDPRVVELGLVNNMSDSALEQTERQILRLLDAAGKEFAIRLRLFALPDVPRDDWGRQHLLRLHYYDVRDLWDSDIDGLILTGAEPRTPDLTQEPYWRSLTQVFDWADKNTLSSIASCLAVHAAVLHFDGINRHSLEQKCFGIFECDKIANDSLLNGMPDRISIPHSRWNGLTEGDLGSCGYKILTRAPRDGIDMFIKSGKSLFVYFQGHPEYEAWTLLGEFRRDVGRFLNGEQRTYPIMPRAYFDADSTDALNAFRDRVVTNPHRELMATFPTDRLVGKLTDPWRIHAVQIYSNWLRCMTERKLERTGPVRSVALP